MEIRLIIHPYYPKKKKKKFATENIAIGVVRLEQVLGGVKKQKNKTEPYAIPSVLLGTNDR